MLITKDINELLTPENIEIEVFEQMNPTLSMLGLFEKKNNNGRDTFAFAREDSNAELDIINGILHEPVELNEASQLPQVKISGINKSVGRMRRIGFEAEFTSEALKDDVNYDKLEKTIQRMGYAMGRALNIHAYTVLVKAAAAPTISLANGAWVDGNDKIDTDFKSMQRAFEAQEGYEYELTNTYTSKTAYWAAEDYYDATRINGFNPDDVRSASMRKIKELESGLLGLDMNVKPAKWYYNIYPEDNLLHDELGSFVHVNRVDKLKEIPRSVKIQMYTEYGFAVNDPKAVLFQEGV